MRRNSEPWDALYEPPVTSGLTRSKRMFDVMNGTKIGAVMKAVQDGDRRTHRRGSGPQSTSPIIVSIKATLIASMPPSFVSAFVGAYRASFRSVLVAFIPCGSLLGSLTTEEEEGGGWRKVG